MTFEDPLIIDIIRSKDATSTVFMGDSIMFEKEIFPSSFTGTDHVQPIQIAYGLNMQPIQIADGLTSVLAERHREEQQSDKYLDLRIVGPWSDVVTNLDYTQGSSSLCGTLPSRIEVLNPNVAHDLEILQSHFLKGNDARNFVPQLYTDQEEREVVINYLSNRYVASE